MNVEVELKEHIQSAYIMSSAHKGNLHEGVTMTMTKVHSQYWIPTLRNLVKLITRSCRAYKKYQAISYPDPKPGPSTKDRTEQRFPFQVIGVDYAGPIFFSFRKDLKAYIL